MWYKLTGIPIWEHSSCINRKSELPLFLEPTWIEGWRCSICNMSVDQEDFNQRRSMGEYTLTVLDPNNFF